MNEKVLTALREQTENQHTCPRCGSLVAWFNHMSVQPADCMRCHANGRLADKGCRKATCPREKPIDVAHWKEELWP